MQLLLQKPERRELVHARDSQGMTPLMLAAAGGHTGACALLLLAGSEIDVCDWRRPAADADAAGNAAAPAAGLTALQHAIAGPSGPHHSTLRLLAAWAADSRPARAWPGAGLEARDRHGQRTALHWAAIVGDWLSARILVNAGADLAARDAHGRTPDALVRMLSCQFASSGSPLSGRRDEVAWLLGAPRRRRRC